MSRSANAPAAAGPHRSQVKETLVSIIIAFALAFVFRAFVIEAFVIPTGSMAPTLMGAHMRFTGPNTGATWPVGPRDMSGPDPRNQSPDPIQGRRSPIRVTDPMSRDAVERRDVARRSGDRILVFKYLASVFEPSRWDVVVFKAPTHPQTNYIKRLIGLPGEQLAIVDGDVFARHAPPGDTATPADLWAQPGWAIARKPDRVQRAVWQPVYDSRYSPIAAGAFRSPWAGATPGWSSDGGAYSYGGGAGRTQLAWDTTVRRIDDAYAYNEVTPTSLPGRLHGVGDLRLRCALRPGAAGLSVSGVIGARGHEFRARIEGERAVLAMRPARDGQGPEDGWVMLDEAPVPALRPGATCTVEFWHADQALHLFLDGRRVARGVYDWNPALRMMRATGLNVEQVARAQQDRDNLLVDTDRYGQPVVYWEFAGTGGGPTPAFSLPSVALDRDLFYQPAEYHRTGEPAAATHPLSTLALGPDHFFVCGDNSPQSEDGRLWGESDEWVRASIDPAPSVVPRDLVIGKAFFVYFPSLLKEIKSPVPTPDFGRMRFIW